MDKPETIKFELDKPVTITLGFDQPKTGEGEYGTWYLYGGKSDGRLVTFFSAEGLHEKLQGYKKGDTIIITKKAQQGEKGLISVFEVVKQGVTEPKPAEIPKLNIPSNGNQSQGGVPVEVWERKDERMVKMNALSHAVEFVTNTKGFTGNETDVAKMFLLAQKCYDWVYQIESIVDKTLSTIRKTIHVNYQKCGVNEEDYRVFLQDKYGIQSSLEITDKENLLEILRYFNPEGFEMIVFQKDIKKIPQSSGIPVSEPNVSDENKTKLAQLQEMVKVMGGKDKEIIEVFTEVLQKVYGIKKSSDLVKNDSHLNDCYELVNSLYVSLESGQCDTGNIKEELRGLIKATGGGK